MAVMTNITESQGEGGEQLENAFAAVAILTCEVWCGRGGGSSGDWNGRGIPSAHTQMHLCTATNTHSRRRTNASVKGPRFWELNNRLVSAWAGCRCFWYWNFDTAGCDADGYGDGYKQQQRQQKTHTNTALDLTAHKIYPTTYRNGLHHAENAI